jgi:hypothetical protein
LKEPEHQYSDVENNEDSITDDVDVVEGNVPSLMTHFINRINDAKDMASENDPHYERTIEGRETCIILQPAKEKRFGRKGSSIAINL